MTIREALLSTKDQLKNIYPESEASSMTDLIIEHLTNSNKKDWLTGKHKTFTEEQENKLSEYLQRLITHEPVQYVLNEAWFCGLKLYVDKNVLIPRPETEELVEWIIANCKFPVDTLSILDIGTGSGDIPIALKRRIRKADVWTCDISGDALAVAQKNAKELGTEIRFLQLDFLEKKTWNQFPTFDIIVSNPPYIPEKDKLEMAPNVLQFEPATALFVPQDDSLVFYKAIAEFGKTHLNEGGLLYTEIHESLGDGVVEMFRSAGYTTELKKDMQLKDRMVKGKRSPL